MSAVPRVSIGIPAYNAARFIGRTLDSVAASRNPPPFEVFVVDDRSQDTTARLARAHVLHPVVHINPENLGPPRTFNECIKQAAGAYLIVLHADDCLEPDYLREMATVLDAHPDVDLVCCLATFIDEDDRVVGQQRRFIRVTPGVIGNAFVRLACDNPIATPCVMARRATYERLGGFDPRLAHSADYDMWLRVAAAGKLFLVPQWLARYRIHAASHSQSRRALENARDILLALEHNLARGVVSEPDAARLRRQSGVNVLDGHLRALLTFANGDWAATAPRMVALVEQHCPGVRGNLNYWCYRVVATMPGALRRALARPIAAVSRWWRLFRREALVRRVRPARRSEWRLAP